MDSLYETLSPIEIKILPYLSHPLSKIIEKSGLDEVSVMRALKFLENKSVISLEIKKNVKIELGVNGVQYKKTELPERTLLSFLEKKKSIGLSEVQKHIKLSDNELKSAIGALRRKDLILIEKEKIILNAKKEELSKKFPEEIFIEQLPLDKEKLTQEQKYIAEILEKRKDIIEYVEDKEITIKTTEKVAILLKNKDNSNEKLIENVTPEIIRENQRNSRFRKYDLIAPVPKIWGGKKHSVQIEIERAKKIWLELGFSEITGKLIDSSFWIFDALFTAQNHPVREMQDTFYIKQMHASLPKEKIVNDVKKAHEQGVQDSKGWGYSWSPEEAKKVVLRTHTTSLSARALSELKSSDLPIKLFAIGKAFRNETIDWSHGIEFFQTEGIVADENANFPQLLGFLREFYKKMGFNKIRFRPSFFPYTEPSVEIDVFHEGKQKWLELGGAGMFRPEVTFPLLGKSTPVLAWGQGLDRIIMDKYKIQDLRELYANDLKKMRNYPVIA
ncbi:MAG: phenylalanine--tRNA ligase subunit alpha [Nanoarchaeota archaeon]